MTKKIIIIIIIAILSVTYFFFVNEYKAESLEEALDTPDSWRYKVINIEVLDDNYFVLSISDNNYLHMAIINEILGRYKTVYSGIQGDVKRVAEVFKVSDNYIPRIKNISDPLLFGVIGDSEISKLVLINIESKEEKNIEIIEKENFRLWVENLNNIKNIDYKLMGYNEKNEVIIEKKLKFTPREIKSQY